MDQAAVKGQSNQPVTDPSSTTNSQLDFLLTNNNAWKMAAGLLMQSFAEIASKEVEANNLMHQAQAQTVSAQADASKTMANAQLGTSLADAGGNFISAGSSGVSAGSGFSSVSQKNALMNTHMKETSSIDDQIKEHKGQIDKHNATTSVGNGESHINVSEREAKIKDLETQKTNLKMKYETEGEKLSTHHESIKALSDLGRGFASMTTSVGKGASEAAHAQASATSSMDQQMVQAEQDAAKSAMETASSAISVMRDVGSISVAAVRG